jgi:hypothetical protein
MDGYPWKIEALETAKKYRTPFGVYVTGIDRKSNEKVAEVLAAKKQKESFNYVGAVMTLPTGVQAMAEIQYVRPYETLNYQNMLHRSFSYAAPGSMYEVSPDYGMLVQAWNIYGVARPVVTGFFGIRPMAHLEKVFVDPAMPRSWAEVALKNVPISLNRTTINKSGETDTISQKQDWSIVIPKTKYELQSGIKHSLTTIDGNTYYEIHEKSFTIMVR